jgi:hypothetical protein
VPRDWPSARDSSPELVSELNESWPDCLSSGADEQPQWTSSATNSMTAETRSLGVQVVKPEQAGAAGVPDRASGAQPVKPTQPAPFASGKKAASPVSRAPGTAWSVPTAGGSTETASFNDEQPAVFQCSPCSPVSELSSIFPSKLLVSFDVKASPVKAADKDGFRMQSPEDWSRLSTEDDCSRGSRDSSTCLEDTDSPRTEEGSTDIPICPVVETVSACSLGSVGHPFRCSLPCKFSRTQGLCKDGKNCVRCHLCRWTKGTEKKKRAELEAMEKEKATSAVQQEDKAPSSGFHGGMRFQL